MYSSSILTSVQKFLSFLAAAYRESTFNKWFLRIDSRLREAAINSRIAGVFIINKNNDASKESRLYKILSRVIRLFGSLGRFFGNWVKGSKVVRVAESILNQSFKYPFRIFGVFAVSLLAANISFGLILNRESRTLLLLKLILLVITLFIARITADFDKTLKDSKVYGLFQWLIEVEK